MNNGWVAVDLDGTLAEYHGWVNTFHIGEPIPLMLERVKTWIAEDKDVRIFTARVDGGEVGAAMGVDEDTVQRYRDVQAITSMIQDWTEKHLGKRLPVTCKKDYGMVQLWDDRAVQVVPNTGVALQERITELESRIKELENPKRLGPQLGPDAERAQVKYVEDFVKDAKAKFAALKEVPPVDYDARILANGKPVPEDGSHKEIDARTGQQKDYIVLTPEERSRGFVRPVRRSYRHLACGCTTTMALAIAETFARSPEFYSGGFCATCLNHFPNAEFVWPDDGTQVGT